MPGKRQDSSKLSSPEPVAATRNGRPVVIAPSRHSYNFKVYPAQDDGKSFTYSTIEAVATLLPSEMRDYRKKAALGLPHCVIGTVYKAVTNRKPKWSRVERQAMLDAQLQSISVESAD